MVAWCLCTMSIDVLGRYIPLISKCLTVDTPSFIPRPSHCPVFDDCGAQKYSKTGWWGKAVSQPPHNSTKFPAYMINNGQRFASISVIILVIVGRNQYFYLYSVLYSWWKRRRGGKSHVGCYGGGTGGRTVTHQGRLYFFEAQITRQFWEHPSPSLIPRPCAFQGYPQ